MGRGPKTDSARASAWLLRRADQAGVALLVLLGLAATVGWWVRQGGLRGTVVEFDRGERQQARFEVDINAAGWPELAQLPGLGEGLARRIVDSRNTEGPFLDHQDLMRVKGIGPKTLEAIRPYLRPLPERGAIAGRPGRESDCQADPASHVPKS